MIPRLQVGPGELLAVPAIHNRSVFAEPVNRACRDDATRPEAVAVELSQDAVDAIVEWFKDLGVGSGADIKLPYMLGLAKSNRRIHPRYTSSAISLQEQYGKPLHEVDPQILRRELNFSPVSLVCLSATDSIIEGIRSAVEFDLPVYGIDLGEMASGERTEAMLQDPILAQDNLLEFVASNEGFLFQHRDGVVDERRERVMAARLKRLTHEYRRVLFTCGIGHWHSLRKRLMDLTTERAGVPSLKEGEHFQRVLVAPSLAICQMDILPELTAHYEGIRSLAPDVAERRINFAGICRESLAEACGKVEPGKPEAMPAFRQYLTNRCLVNQRSIPNLFEILSAAREMVSESFSQELGKLLIMDALDWAEPDQWPDLPYLSGVRANTEGASAGLQATLEERGKPASRFYISHRSGNGDPEQDWRLPFLSDRDRNSEGNSGAGCVWTWPPCEALLFGTAYAATEIVNRKSRVHCPEPFSGSLHEGVDVKATLRAAIRGEKRIQVKVQSSSFRGISPTDFDDEPAVLIFEPEAEVRDGQWGLFQAGISNEMRQFVENKTRFDEVTESKGHEFIASIQFSSDPEAPEHLRPHVRQCRYLYGITLFNPALNNPQTARCLEACDYRGGPILRSRSIGSLFQHYQQQHKLILSQSNWVSSLIRMALPYAKRRVTVVVPESQVIDPVVLRDAAARHIKMEFLPLTHFSKERIATIRNQYFVRALDMNKLKFSEEVSAVFGESPRKHLNLLPERIRAQLEP